MRVRHRIRDEAGFTIIETMAASLIMAIAFLGLASVHVLSIRAQSLGNNQGLATFLANEQIERMRRSSFAEIISATQNVEVEGVPFEVIRTVTPATLSKKVEVAIRWEERLGAREIVQVSAVSQVTNP